MHKDDQGQRPLHSEEIQRQLDEPQRGGVFREPLETLFQHDQSLRREGQLRSGLLLGLVIYTLFGMIDWLLMRDMIGAVWFLRFGALALVLLFVTLRSVRRPASARPGQLRYFSTLLIALAIEGIIALATPQARDAYLMTLVLLFLFSFILLQTPFQYSLRIALTVVMLHNVVLVAVAAAPALELIIHNIVLCSAVGIALLTSYLLEGSERRGYLQNLLVQRQKAELEEVNARLERLSVEDPLTGLANRRRFEAILDEEWRRCLRQELPLAVMMVDVDGFKLYNDTYGHQAGDECLARVAQELKLFARRPGDCVARFGGEEFVIVWPGATADEAYLEMQKLVNQIRSLRIRHHVSPVCDVVTVSAGIAACVPGGHDNPFRLVRDADMALYHAKRQGRNRCVRAVDQASPPSADIVILNAPRP
ncbi:MAG: diguanylate cyclase [Gammaproteobacteria bacterium]